jgi:DNA-binding sugar fermentation-stimulating protein
MRLYGLTLADFACLLDEQDYLCAVCKEPGNLVVDHCHETGQVRGLLCHGCNVGLGYFVDSPTRLRQAAEYLENNE